MAGVPVSNVEPWREICKQLQPHSHEARANYKHGLTGRWPHPGQVSVLETRAYWDCVIQIEKLVLPAIIEDRNSKNTCVRIPLGFVKAIMIMRQAPHLSKITVHIHGKGDTTTIYTDRMVTFPETAWSLALKSLELTLPQDWTIIQALSPTWQTFAIAYNLFETRGQRKLQRLHIGAIILTITICQIKAFTKNFDVDLLDVNEILNSDESLYKSLLSLSLSVQGQLKTLLDPLHETEDEDAIGLFSTFELTLILANEFVSCSEGQTPKPIDIQDFFNVKLAAKAYQNYGLIITSMACLDTCARQVAKDLRVHIPPSDVRRKRSPKKSRRYIAPRRSLK